MCPTGPEDERHTGKKSSETSLRLPGFKCGVNAALRHIPDVLQLLPLYPFMILILNQCIIMCNDSW